MANSHSSRGLHANVLLGEIDAIKFHETCTLFAVAAAVADGDSVSVFVDALRLLGGLNEQAVRGLQDQQPHFQRRAKKQMQGLVSYTQKQSASARFFLKANYATNARVFGDSTSLQPLDSITILAVFAPRVAVSSLVDC